MSTYWFELMVGPIDDPDEAVEALYTVCDDGQFAGDERGGAILFSREAPNATEAILTAIDDAEKAGLSVTGIQEDLLTVEDIAEKTGVSGQAVNHWVTGQRGPGGFPAPVIHRSSKVKLYSWAQVSQWLSGAGLGKVDQVAVEVACAAASVEALLRARHVLRSAPTGLREGLQRLMAV